MLKLLLDEQISPAVAEGLRRKAKGLTVYALAEWKSGGLIGRSDEELLTAAAAEKLTLVTYDRRTIPPILKAWAEEERAHAGVIFVDDKTIPPSKFGALIAALHAVYQESGDWEWTGRIYMVQRKA